jgi:hypothetical protein
MHVKSTCKLLLQLTVLMHLVSPYWTLLSKEPDTLVGKVPSCGHITRRTRGTSGSYSYSKFAVALSYSNSVVLCYKPALTMDVDKQEVQNLLVPFLSIFESV